MGEANPLPIDDEHARFLRLDQRRPDVAVARNGPFENGRRRAREGGCGEHEVASAVRQAVEAVGHEVLDAAGHRERVSDDLFVSLACERVRHLEGEERIATGDLRQPTQGRARQGIAEARADQLVQPGKRQRSGRDTLDSFGRKRTCQPERQVVIAGRASGEQQAGASR